MNARSLIKVFAALALLASLGGCASLSKSECLAANWEDVGIRDGASGRPEEYLIQHSKACAKVDVAPDRGAWLQGREQGLDRFCVPYRMYQIGEYGGGFDAAICRRYDQDRLINAYEQGLRSEPARQSSWRPSTAKSKASTTGSTTRTWTRRKAAALAFRLGQLAYQRNDAERAYEDARFRARNL